MATLGNRSFVLVCTALTIVLLIVAAGMAGNTQQNQQRFNDQTSEQQGFRSDNQMGSQDQQSGTQVPQQPGYQRSRQMGTQGRQGARAGMQANRNQQLERQVASQLRDQGLGQQGQLLVLAVGNRVILLGATPDQNEKQQAEQISQQVSGVGQVDSRIVVLSQARRKNDTQLQRDIQQQLSRLPSGAGQNIQVQARNGRIILRGQVNDWTGMADAIQAAFNAGASYIVSQITTGQTERTYGRMGTDQGRGQMDQNRYGAGQQDQGGYAAGQQDRSRYVADWQDQSRSSTSQQSQQDQYGQYGYQAPADRTYDQDQQYDRYDRSRYQGDMDRSRSDQYDRSGARTTARDRWRQTSEDHRQEQELTSGLKSDIQGLEDVTVLVAGNKVFLFGRAQNQSAKDQATSLAKEISGIQRVQNNLIVSTRGMQRQDDATLRTNITEELQSSPFLDNADRIRVNVRNGTATLSGQVDSFGELVAAINSTYEGGAASVRNRITISGQTTPGREGEGGYYPSYGYGTGQSTTSGFGTQSGTSDQSTSGGYTSQNVVYQTRGDSSSRSMSGQSSDQEDEDNQDDSYPSYDYTPSEGDESQWQDTGDAAQGQQMGRQRTSTSDMVLAQRIALELQRQLPSVQNIHVLDPQAINVMVSEGTVMLHGTAPDQNTKQQAEQIARSVSGARNVQNNLIFLGQPQQRQTTMDMGQLQQTTMTSTDRRLAQRVQQQLQRQFPGSNIHVTISQGTAILHGTVQNQNQKEQAEQVTKSISGAQSVENQLTVSAGQGAFPPFGYNPPEDGTSQQDTGSASGMGRSDQPQTY